MKKTIRDRDILIEVFKNYVIDIPQIRVLILPTTLCMIISRYLEVKVSEVTQKISLLFINRDENLKFGLVTTYFLVSILSCLLIELQGFIFTGSVQRAFRVASKNTFKEFISLEYGKFHSLGSGEIQSSINRKSKAISEIIDVLALNFFPTILVIVLTNLKLFYFLGFIPALIVNITLVIYATITIKIAIWRNKMRAELNESTDKSNNKLYDSLCNYETILAFNNENFETEMLDKTLKKVEEDSNKLWRSFYLLNFLQRLTFSMQTAFIILFGTYGICMAKMKPDTFILYLTISRILASNLDKLGFMYCRYSSAIMNAKSTHFVAPKKIKAKEELTINRLKESIEFKNVGFYLEKKKILANINFKIRKSEKIALIGKNGTGKSTLMKMILKQYPYEGFVNIDGEDIQNISSKSIRDLVSYIQQDSSLFNDTIRYNIKYSDMECPDYFMTNLCSRMNVNNSFCKLRDGYNTIVGERGKYLSGGERQKVALMRAILKDTDIMLMDEPTSALDKESEHFIIKNIFKMFPTKTVIMIVHNMDLLNLFDRIFYLENGTIREIKENETIPFVRNSLGLEYTN